MKKLEKLKLHNLEGIGVKEQRAMKGGDGDGIEPGMIGEVVVIGQAPDNYYWWGAFIGDMFNGESYNSYGYGLVSASEEVLAWSGSDIPQGSSTGSSSNIINNCTMSENGINFIKSWEKGPDGSAALTPYDDNGTKPGGNMTIGWGHVIKAGEDFSAGITKDQADSMFLADLQRAINDVNNSVHVSLTQEQFDALVSYSFNIGGLKASPNCLAKLNNGDYSGAADEMDIVTSAGETYEGLVIRRANEQTIFNYGTYNLHN